MCFFVFTALRGLACCSCAFVYACYMLLVLFLFSLLFFVHTLRSCFLFHLNLNTLLFFFFLVFILLVLYWLIFFSTIDERQIKVNEKETKIKSSFSCCVCFFLFISKCLIVCISFNLKHFKRVKVDEFLLRCQ